MKEREKGEITGRVCKEREGKKWGETMREWMKTTTRESALKMWAKSIKEKRRLDCAMDREKNYREIRN